VHSKQQTSVRLLGSQCSIVTRTNQHDNILQAARDCAARHFARQQTDSAPLGGATRAWQKASRKVVAHTSSPASSVGGRPRSSASNRGIAGMTASARLGAASGPL